MRMKEIAAALAAMLFCGGCLLVERPQKEVALYDLAVSAPLGAGPQFRRVFNESPSRLKMLFREPDGRIRETENACWVQTPEAMLKRYLAGTFRNGSGPVAELTILRFEMVSPHPRAVIAVELTLFGPEPGKKRVKYLEVSAPLAGPDRAAAAAAMSKSAEQLAKAIQHIQQEK